MAQKSEARGVGEVVGGDSAIAVDAPKEDYRVRSTDYGTRPKAARGQGELEYGWLGEEKTAMTSEALAAGLERREGLVTAHLLSCALRGYRGGRRLRVDLLTR